MPCGYRTWIRQYRSTIASIQFSKSFISSGNSPGRKSLRTGADRSRTDDLLVANQSLSQLSYGPDLPDRLETAAHRILSRIHPNNHARIAMPKTAIPSIRIFKAASIGSKNILVNLFSFFWSAKVFLANWAQMDSNHRPHPYQGCALPTEL